MHAHLSKAVENGLMHPMMNRLAGILRGKHAHTRPRNALASTGLEALQTTVDVTDRMAKNGAMIGKTTLMCTIAVGHAWGQC